MLENYKIIDFNVKENSVLVEFLSKVLDRRVNSEDWDWEFNTLENTIFNYYSNTGNVIATQSMLPVYMTYNGNTVLTYKSESTYILKEFRGKQIFENLYNETVQDAFKKGGGVIWGFTPAINAWKKNFNFSVEEDVMLNVSFRCGFNKTTSIKRGIKNLCLFPIVLINRCSLFKWSSELIIKGIVGDSQIAKFNEEFLHQEGYFGINLTRAFLQWRMDTNPFVNYDKIAFYRKEQLIGLIFYSCNEESLNISYFAFCNEQDYSTAISLLYTEAKKKYSFSSMSYWGNKNNQINNKIFNLLRNKLFSNASIDPSRSLVYKFKDSEYLPTENWFINSLWTEGIKI